MPKGGYKPGAGRPPKAKVIPKDKPFNGTPLEYMIAVMCDPEADVTRRDRMAIAAAPFMHGRAYELNSTKQAHRQEKAEEAAAKFSVPAAPPRLALAA